MTYTSNGSTAPEGVMRRAGPMGPACYRHDDFPGCHRGIQGAPPSDPTWMWISLKCRSSAAPSCWRPAWLGGL